MELKLLTVCVFELFLLLDDFLIFFFKHFPSRHIIQMPIYTNNMTDLKKHIHNE